MNIENKEVHFCYGIKIGNIYVTAIIDNKISEPHVTTTPTGMPLYSKDYLEALAAKYGGKVVKLKEITTAVVYEEV